MSQEQFPKQHQENRPGESWKMNPQPQDEPREGTGCNKLTGKVAIITGGDSGIGRAVALAFAVEGADVAVIYLNEHKDAEDTKKRVEQKGRKCLLISGDIADEQFCKEAVEKTLREFGKLNILVNNSGEQHPQRSIEDITSEQLERTFKTNIFGMFYLVKAALKHLQEGDSIINTTSITAYVGSKDLIDYSSTKGAIVTFTRSLSQHLTEKGIRVNAVAPGPIWTPLIPSTFDEDKTAGFGSSYPMKRAGQPNEVAPSFVFLASDDASYMTGQVLHPNGGVIVNG